MAEGLLDEREGHPGFEQVGGVAVAQRMDVGALVDAALFDRAHEGALEARAGDGFEGRVRLGSRGEEPEGMAMRAPVGAEEIECGIGERDVAILAAFAVDVEQLAVAVNIGELLKGKFWSIREEWSEPIRGRLIKEFVFLGLGLALQSPAGPLTLSAK